MLRAGLQTNFACHERGDGCVQIYERSAVNVANYNARDANVLRSANGAAQMGPGRTLRVPQVIGSSKTLEAKCKRAYDMNAHLYFINSVSMCPDQSTFLSADDLSIRLWNLEFPDANQMVLDLRPSEPRLEPNYGAVRYCLNRRRRCVSESGNVQLEWLEWLRISNACAVALVIHAE
jgi:hypothetical protein